MVVLVTVMVVMVEGVVENFERALGVDSLHMVVVAFLDCTHISLKAQNCAAVLAHLAIHGDVAGQDLLDAFHECVDHGGVVVKVGRLDEPNMGVAGGHIVGCVINALHQNSGEQEIGKYDNTLVTQACGMFEAGVNQREGNAGVGGFRPAKAKALP